MIDFQDMNNRQQEGLTAIDSLQEDEKSVLQHYCSLATEMLIQLGTQRQVPVEQMVINAYKYGIALGLRLKVTHGEITGRP